MAINTALLIAAPMLQDFLIDKDGLPMANGTITCYQDNSRTTLKNWYYQTGTPGNYTYIALPNPLTLSAAGTICDINGVDTIPFYYPYDENDENISQPYYITIVNEAETNQITRANFPFNRLASNSLLGDLNVNNYIVNNVFWRNIGAVTLTSTPSGPQEIVVAPSQHDGFQFPDIQFFKNNNTATDVITFTKFLASDTPTLTGDITPEYYLNHKCTVAGTSELYKYYLFPISLHLLTLSAENNTYTFTIQAQVVSGGNSITLALIQDPGTAFSFVTSAFAPTQLTANWVKYEMTSILPSTASIPLSQAGNDAVYLQISMPLTATFEINFTKPSFYLVNGSPTNDFATYDQIDTIINSPRTGDIRTSINSWYYFGWVPMNDGTIGNASSNATTRANIDTWPLFNLIWTLASAYDSGSNFNPVAQMYTSSMTPTATNYGSSAYADWIANNQLALTKAMGRVFTGTVPLAAVLAATWIQSVAITNSGGNILATVTSTANYFIGQPIAFTATTPPGNIVANAIYYVTNITATTFQVATTYANALAGTPVVMYSSGGTAVLVDLNVSGSSTGQYMHTQLVAELAAHTHTYTLPNTPTNVVLPNTPTSFVSAVTPGTLTSSTGSSAPFNIVQPTTFYNVYIKL